MKNRIIAIIVHLIPILFFGQSRAFDLTDDIFGSRCFVQNNGQFDLTDEKISKILYKYDYNGECVFFTEKGLVYKQTELKHYSHRQVELFEEGRKKLDKPKDYFVFMTWANSNDNINVVSSEKVSYYFSYGEENLRSYAFKKLTYKNVYDNIDIEYIIPENKSVGLKYNIILNPGADINDIRILYSGDLNKVFISGGGEVIVSGKVNDIKEHVPFSYFKSNSGVEIPCHFQLTNNVITFVLDSPLKLDDTFIIDPWVSSITTLSANNYAYDVDFDYAGNLYIHGGTAPFKVAKYSVSGVLLWTFAGTVSSQSWTSSGDYPPKPLVGNFLVHKISQKCYVGQGWQSNGSRIIRLDANGIYDNFITTANVPMKECWDMAFNCNTNEVVTMGGHEGTNSSGGIIDQNTGTLNPTTFYPANIGSGHDVVSGVIDENGVLYVIYASAQTLFMNNKIIRVNAAYNNNVWMVPSSYNSFAENDNKANYVGSGLGLGSSNGFNCLGVNNNYLFYYDGLNLAAYNKSTGALLSSTQILGQAIRSQGGIAIDDCNNIYLGGNGTIVCYNFNGTSFTALPNISLGITIPNKYVYDLKLDKNSNLLYACGSGFVGVYNAINSNSCSNQLSIVSKCYGTNNASASATLTTNVLNPIVSYTWTNSAGTIVSQTNNTTSLIDSLNGLTNGVYTLYSQINAPCGPINTQTINVNCVITSTSNCAGSLIFNDVSDEVLLPLTNQMYSSNGFTWECWFKLNTPFGLKARSLIMNEDPVVYEDIFLGFGWNLGTGNFPINHLGFKVDGPNSTTGPTNVSCDYAPPGGFLLGTWYHAAGVMDYVTQTAKLYLNGLLVDTKTVVSDSLTRTIQGHLSYSPNLALGGNMDEVRIWKKARTATEIFSDYDHCLNGNETDLVSYYRCNQSTGSILIDGTVNGNNGTFANSTGWSSLQPNLLGGACIGVSGFSITTNSNCIGLSATAIGTITTSVASPTISYTWINSLGNIVSQTNNSTSLIDSVANLANGVYTFSVQLNTPCSTFVSTQTININCVPTSTSLCSGNLGSPIFFEDFGSGASLYGPALPPGVTNYTYLQGIPNNGTYVIASSSNPSGTNAGYVNDNHDHTGNPNGYMMVVNSDYPASEVYRKHVTGLCPNTTYVFSAYLANNNSPDAVTNVCGASYVYANIKFQTEFPVGTVLNSTTSGNLSVASNSVTLPWIQYGFTFTTGAGQTSVDVVLKNNAPGGCGNDYVVDDISLAPCGPGVALSIVPNSTVFCPGSTVSLQSTFTSGGYTVPQYQWQYSGDGGLTWGNISGATSSNYTISSVTQSQGGMYQLLVSENGSINLSSCRIVAGPLSFSVVNIGSISVASPSICAGNSVTLIANGATTYTWSNNSNLNSITVSPSSTTVYTVTGAIGTCTNQAVSTVSVIPSSTISITGNTIICAGQSATLTASGSNNYIWNSGSTTNTIVVNPIISTNYSVTAPIGVCSNTAVATVSVVSIPSLTISPNTSFCQGASSSVSLTVSGANAYSWANSATLSSATGSAVVASPLATTNYTVTGSSSICSNTAIVTVSVNPSPTITAVSFTNTSCGLSNGAIIVTSLPSNNTYTWSSGISSTTNAASNLASGNYTITANNGTCQTNTVISIFSSVPLSITSSTVIPSNCNLNDGSISVVDNMTGSNYSWSPNVSATNSATGLPTGNYALTILNGACSTSTIFNVGSTGGPIGFITITAPNCESDDGSIIIDSITSGVTPFFTNFNNQGYTNSMLFENLSTGSYSLSIRDSSLCETEYILTVPDSKTEFTLYIPNSFTPNNDKINDVWYIKGICLDNIVCSIYNRWGEKIKELKDMNDGWDGTYKGASVPDGVYVYLIEVTTKDGTVNKAGHITVFR